MSDEWNRWAGYKGADLERPVTKRKPRTAVDRDAEFAVAAEALGKEWRRTPSAVKAVVRRHTPTIAAGLDAISVK